MDIEEGREERERERHKPPLLHSIRFYFLPVGEVIGAG